MIQYLRIASALLGMWLGAAVFADIAVARNFSTIDPFLRAPRSSTIAAELQKIGPERERPILRRNAGEENNALFTDWEIAELLIGSVLILLLFADGKPSIRTLAPAVLMLGIVAVQRIYLTPHVAELGRQISDLSTDAPLNRQFWTLHGIYSGMEIVKLITGFGLAVYLILPRKKETRPARLKQQPQVVKMNG